MLSFLRILIFGFVFLAACGQEGENNISDYTELAMKPGMKIEAVNKNGRITIEYLSPLKRRFQWEGHDEVRTLIPRKKRWRGRLGAYNPATRFFWEFWKPWPRIVAEDSQIRFSSMEEVEAFLRQGSAVLDWVYTNSGLVVGFVESPDRGQVNIDVYQIYLNGEKPNGIKGSRPENIKVTYGSDKSRK